MSYDKKIEQWVEKCIDKEFKQKKSKYLKDGSGGFGAAITIARRVENSFNKSKDFKSKKFFADCMKYMNDNIFD